MRTRNSREKSRPILRTFTATTALLLIAAWLPRFFSGQTLSAQDQTQAYLLRLRDEPVIDHLRHQTALPVRRMNLQDEVANRHRSQLLARQERVRQQIDAFSRADVRAQMDTVYNGLVVRLRPSDVAAVENLPNVAEVIPSVRYHKLLDTAAPLVQLPAAWSDTQIGGEANAGAGVKIGVIDTGIDISHPMFQDSSLVPPQGYPRFNTPTPSCPVSDQRFTNSKVIVARNYVNLLPFLELNCDAMDRDGHGSFVSGIAAGRRVQGPFANIAGAAPKAFLGSYKVTGTPGINTDTTREAIIKALDDATKDGMDIVNISLGGSFSEPPSQDPLAQAVAAAVNAGVTVVVAAGNDGPATGTITSPGTSPAAITVGATTNSRLLAQRLLISGSEPVPQLLQFIAFVVSNGPAIGSDIGPAPLTDIFLLDAAGTGCEALPSDSLSGQIALIRRGECTFELKVLNAALAGAIAVVIYNHQLLQPPIPMDVGSAVQIPSVMIGNTEGTSLASYLMAVGAATGALTAQQQAIPLAANRVTGFASAGPSLDFGIKPDLVAPGKDIYSATQRNFSSGDLYDSTGFSSASGTSFSSPLVAGAAALVQQAFPGYSPAQIKSALVQTAVAEATPFKYGTEGVLAYGNGLLDVAAALASPATVSPASISFGTNVPGSTLNRSTTLNITNVSNATDTFTVTAPATSIGVPVAITATPAIFTLASGGSTNVSIQATSAEPVTGTVEGHLDLSSQNTGRSLTIPYWGNFLLPRIDATGVGNLASLSFGPGPAAPGSLILISGVQMTPGVSVAPSATPVPTSLAGIRVMISGARAPLLYVSPTRIIAQVPPGFSGGSFATVNLIVNGLPGPPALMTLAPTGPGIFTANQTGSGLGVVLHAANHTAVTPRNPARGGELLELYVNGLGATEPSVASGEAAPVEPLARVVTPPTVVLGDVPFQVHSAELAPGFVGVYRVIFEVPPTVPGGEVPLILRSNGVTSNVVTVPIVP